jgi:hypothetical protein
LEKDSCQEFQRSSHQNLGDPSQGKTQLRGLMGSLQTEPESYVIENSDVTGSQQYPNGADSPQRIPNHHHHHGAEVYR